MEKFFELSREVNELKTKLKGLEFALEQEAKELRKQVECWDTLSGDKSLKFNGKSWIVKKSQQDWSLSVYPVLKNGKAGKKRVAQVFGGISQLRLQIALGIIK